MFGIMALLCIICYAIYTFISNGIDDAKSRRIYRDKTTNTYLDHNGVSRDLRTNKYRSVTFDNNGDRHLWGQDIGDTNLSQVDRQKEFEKYQREPSPGRTTVYWEPSPHYKMGTPILLGKRYKDLSTGRLLVVRSHNWFNYYVDLETLKVLRYTDSQTRELKRTNRYSKETEMENIKTFQSLINKQRADLSYIGDPTYGKPTYSSQLQDNWKPEKVFY